MSFWCHLAKGRLPLSTCILVPHAPEIRRQTPSRAWNLATVTDRVSGYLHSDDAGGHNSQLRSPTTLLHST